MEQAPDDRKKTSAEGLDEKHAQQKGSLAERLLRIGKDCAAHLEEAFLSEDHGNLLYGEKDGTPDR